MSADALQEQLEQRWETLPRPSSDDRVTTVDLPSPTGNGPLMLGRSRAGRSLLVPLAKGGHRVFREDRRSAGVQLIRRPLTLADGDKWFAELVCLRSELDSIFAAFCADVIVRITKSAGHEPADIAAQALRWWRSLFSGSGRRLGPQQLRGLFGELTMLERLLSAPEGDVLTWIGPLRKPHDFALGGEALEVKTSGVGETVVRIHGVSQLQPPEGGSLKLVHLQVEEDEGGRTVPEVVAAIRKRVGPTPLMLRLELAGYQTVDEKHYENVRLQIQQETWYEVDAAFPRVVPDSFAAGDVPVGVGDLHYDVDFASSAPTVLGQEAVEEHFARLRGAA